MSVRVGSLFAGYGGPSGSASHAIADSTPGAACRELVYGSLFSGYEGLTLGVQSVLPGRTAWHCEIDPAASRILAHHWPQVPNLGDITAVDWAQVEPVDVITGGSPCQDVSHAGARRGMRAGTRSGLWASMCDAIDIIRPGLVVWENVRGVLSAGADSNVEPCPICVGDEREAHLRALGRVVGDLADIGYDAAWTGLRAADVGAPHGRFRVFVVAWPAADADGLGRERAGGTRGWWPRPADAGRDAADADSDALRQQPVTLAGCGGQAVAGLAGAEAPADTDVRGRERVGRVDTLGRDADGRGGADVAWGDYEPATRPEIQGTTEGIWGEYAPAIARWQAVLGRPAPAPTEPGRNGPRLSPSFVEFLMGLPEGHVTDVPGLSRNDQLKALGNGCVPQQVAYAVSQLLRSASEDVQPMREAV